MTHNAVILAKRESSSFRYAQRKSHVPSNANLSGFPLRENDAMKMKLWNSKNAT